MTNPQTDTLLWNRMRAAIADQMPRYLQNQRWFRAKARKIRSVSLIDSVGLPLSDARALIALIRVEFEEGHYQSYVIPLFHSPRPDAGESESLILRLHSIESAPETVLTDALASQEFLRALLTAIEGGLTFRGECGTLLAHPSVVLKGQISEPESKLPARVLKVEQSNTSIVYGDRFILKFYRSVEEGVSPDFEVGQFLTEVVHFPNTPQVGGSLEYRTDEGKTLTLGILQEFVPNQGDAWSFTLRSLKDLTTDIGTGDVQKSSSGSRPGAGRISGWHERLETHVSWMGLLGKRTAEMHVALASAKAEPAFSPEPFTHTFREMLRTSLHDMAVRNFDLLNSKLNTLPEPLQQAAKSAVELEDQVLLTFHTILEKSRQAMRTRIHGDYHLGQVLFTGSDFMIIDFEGEPAKAIEERRAKRSPLQDLAGMLRSFQYAERAAYLEISHRVDQPLGDVSAIGEMLARWRRAAARRFIEEYRCAAEGASFLPERWEDAEELLRLHLLEKAIYELGYELNNRPNWLSIPLSGIEELVGHEAHKSA